MVGDKIRSDKPDGAVLFIPTVLYYPSVALRPLFSLCDEAARPGFKNLQLSITRHF